MKTPLGTIICLHDALQDDRLHFGLRLAQGHAIAEVKSIVDRESYVMVNRRLL